MTIKESFDLFVVGGGINGVGIAVDAAGRGLKTGLCEMGDLGGATSSASSKLIHGGLRYLEHYEFRLVKEALAEREILLKMAPHIAWPMRFCLPHRPQLRPAWMIRAGLFLYDHLSNRVSLPGCKSVRFNQRSPLRSKFQKGFEYSDAWVDDARLVILNAIALRERGGQVYPRTRAISAERKSGLWHIELLDTVENTRQWITAKGLVNATGPWVTDFLQDGAQEKSSRKIRLIKGSHIVVPRIHDEDRAYILQNDDQRIVFVIPWLDRFSLVGTTDVEYQGNPAEPDCSELEKEYLCRVVNEHFKQQVSVEDIVWDYSGVRPLCEDESSDPQAVTRDYTFDINDLQGRLPLLSVFGGKLTTYRKLAEHAMDKLCQYYPEAGTAWTSCSQLPGAQNQSLCSEQLLTRYPWLDQSIIKRFARCYGSLAYQILNNAEKADDLGCYFGAGLYQAEVDYLIRNEWAKAVDDIIWRRTKLGLFLNKQEQAELDAYVRNGSPRLSPDRTGKQAA